MSGMSLADDEMPIDLERPCTLCGGYFEVSGPYSCEFLQCCALPVHVQCATELVSEQSVVCPHCREECPATIDFSRFQHECCINDVDVLAGECSILRWSTDIHIFIQPPLLSPADASRAFGKVCCSRVVIIAFFCTRGLHLCFTDPLMVASLDHLHVPVDLSSLPSNAMVRSLCAPSDLPPAPPIWPLCCFRTGSDFEPLERPSDATPDHPTAHGGTSDWVPQWVCRCCGSFTSTHDIPPQRTTFQSGWVQSSFFSSECSLRRGRSLSAREAPSSGGSTRRQKTLEYQKQTTTTMYNCELAKQRTCMIEKLWN